MFFELLNASFREKINFTTMELQVVIKNAFFEKKLCDNNSIKLPSSSMKVLVVQIASFGLIKGILRPRRQNEKIKCES